MTAEGAGVSGVLGGVEIRRSARRKRTVSARREGGKTVVLMPAGLTQAREDELVADMLAKLERSERRRRGAAASAVGDEALARRAGALSAEWLDGAASPASVRWVAPMRTRWASCTPAEGTIRISEAARGFPRYVQDYLLVHELAHLVAPGGHTPRFWELVRRYPRTERALGYLEAASERLQEGPVPPEHDAAERAEPELEPECDVPGCDVPGDLPG